MLEQKPNSEQKDETLDSSSHNSTNANVVGLPSLSGQELKDYIFETFTVPIKSVFYHLTIA